MRGIVEGGRQTIKWIRQASLEYIIYTEIKEMEMDGIFGKTRRRQTVTFEVVGLEAI